MNIVPWRVKNFISEHFPLLYHLAVKAVLALLEDREGAAAIRQRARRFVEAERSWASSVSRYAAVYGPILNAPHSGAAH